MLEPKTELRRDEPDKKAKTLEEYKSETELLKIQIELEELRGLRDKPDILRQKEEELNARESGLQTREDAVVEKETRLDNREAHLATKEISASAQTQSAREELEKGRTVVQDVLNKLKKATATLNQYIDFSRLSHYVDLQERLKQDDIEKLQQAIDMIKKWREWQ